MTKYRKTGLKAFLPLFLFTFLLLGGCTDTWKFGDAFLDKAPGGDITKDTVFNNAEYTRNFLWSCYAKMRYGLPFLWEGSRQGINIGIIDALSDEVHSHVDWDGVNLQYYSGAYSAPSTGNDDNGRFPYMKYNVWETVHDCYTFLENVDRSPLEQAEKTRLKAEAKCIIASRYFDLFRNYGGLPIVKQSYTGAEGSYDLPRGTIEETVNFMVGLLDEAIPDLPWSLGSDESNWEGRFTQAGAMGLKAKILDFAASPLFNNSDPYCTEGNQEANEKHQCWYGDYQESRWQAVADACKAFFDNVNSKGWYALVQADKKTPGGYRAAFRKAYASRGTPEVLISTRDKNTANYEWRYMWFEWNEYGTYTPTEDYMEAFDWKDGRRFNYDDLEKNGDLDSMFIANGDPRNLTRDPRLYETILVNGMLGSLDGEGNMSGNQMELWVGGNDKKGSVDGWESGMYATGFGNNKFFMFYDYMGYYTHWPYLRMAEMYLIYAEALTQTGHIDQAIPYVDAIRARVGLKGLRESGIDVSTKDKMIDAILHERNCEFGIEESRFYDLIRYRRADIFSKPLHGLRIRRIDANGKPDDHPYKGNHADGVPFPAHFTYERIVLSNKSRAWWTSFSPKWYLSAFPTAEINKGYGLTQNPGW